MMARTVPLGAHAAVAARAAAIFYCHVCRQCNTEEWFQRFPCVVFVEGGKRW